MGYRLDAKGRKWTEMPKRGETMRYERGGTMYFAEEKTDAYRENWDRIFGGAGSKKGPRDD